jgi:tetratricopeptide (TPR) repeat protein
VSLPIRTIAISLLAAAIPAVAQISERQPVKWFAPPLLDASNNEFQAYLVQPERIGMEKGAVSVHELEQPLRGKPLEMIRNVQRLLAKGQTEKAFRLMEQASSDRVAAPYVASLRGEQYLRRGDLEAARAELDTAVALLPSHIPNHFNLALALAKLHRNDEALQEARRALKLDPGSANLHHLVGVLLVRVGQVEEARFYLK